MTSRDGSEPPLVAGASRFVAEVAAANGLLAAFDYDGVLAPITTDPARATMSDQLTGSLRTLAARGNVAVAVVSGRALADLTDRVDVDDVVFAGNHGLELSRDGERTVQEDAAQLGDTLAGICSRLRRAVADVPGCRVEDKELTLSVHVRETPAEHVAAVRQAVSDAVSAQPEFEVSEGKQVLEVRPAVGHDKGTAMTRLVAEHPSDWLPLYLGDDTTDEDAFEAIQPEGVGIHVGTREDTAARYRLPSQEQVPAFVSWLASAPLAAEGPEKG